MTFANSLDPDQTQQNFGSDLDQNCLKLLWHSWKNFLKKLILNKKSADHKKAWNISQGMAGAELTLPTTVVCW